MLTQLIFLKITIFWRVTLSDLWVQMLWRNLLHPFSGKSHDIFYLKYHVIARMLLCFLAYTSDITHWTLMGAKSVLNNHCRDKSDTRFILSTLFINHTVSKLLKWRSWMHQNYYTVLVFSNLLPHNLFLHIVTAFYKILPLIFYVWV